MKHKYSTYIGYIKINQLLHINAANEDLIQWLRGLNAIGSNHEEVGSFLKFARITLSKKT